MSKQYVHQHAMAKTSVKFQNDWQKTVRGVALTSQLLTNRRTGHGTPISHLRANARATKRKNVAPRFVFLYDFSTSWTILPSIINTSLRVLGVTAITRLLGKITQQDLSSDRIARLILYILFLENSKSVTLILT